MKPKLYIHIGHSKVASSSIQRFLDVNIHAIRDAGYLVANVDCQFPTDGEIFACPVGVLEQARDAGEIGFEKAKQRVRDLHETLQKTKFDKAILSAENLCNPRFEQMFVEAPEMFDVRVVYYIRRQDEWLVSAWKQWGIKSGKGLEEFCLDGVRTRYPSFSDAIKRWEPIGHEFHVRPLHRSALKDGSVTADFAAAVDLGDGELEHVGVANPSFDVAVLDVLSHNPWLFDHRDDDRVFDFLTEFLPPDVKPMRAVLEWETRTRICKFFEEENRALQARFFPDTRYEKLFSPHEMGSGARPPEREALLYRYLGLQMKAIMGLQAEVKRLQAKLGGE